MRLSTANYVGQRARWPAAGRQILTQFDEYSVIVYQAYRPAIAKYRSRPWFVRRRLQLFAHELDQTEFSLDDVSVAMGIEGGPGIDYRSTTATRVLRSTPFRSRPFVPG